MTNSLEYTNGRGNNRARRRRKLLILSSAGGWGGDGFDVPCWECGILLEYEDLFCDRIIPSERDGRYSDPDNIAPHCCLCSHRQGQRRTIEIRNGRRNDNGCCQTV